MILTNKALKDFYTWIEKQDFPLSKYAVENNLVRNVFVNALIIEWFDSECIHIDTYMCVDRTYDFKVNFRGYNVFCISRQEATEQAILKANEIYNERTNISN